MLRISLQEVQRAHVFFFSPLTSKITFLEIEDLLNYSPEDSAPFGVVRLK